MGHLIEVYQVSKRGHVSPAYVEFSIDFVDLGISLLQVNPNHPLVRDMRSRGRKVVDDLKRRKFRGVKFVWQGQVEGTLMDSEFRDEVSYCELCNEFHAISHESAFEPFTQMPASTALAEMLNKYGVLARRPRLPRAVKS